ncbi:hypothetical protein CLAFUW4_03849 [Fulvia fulva]|uniref:GH16 domain-containing protein n=1 Tax=Passalora fulva TaxID=5499 RepID=A0A9Q8P669_PASFU|nr:uncharacterized protein CLAFUR5_03821 [Fulvia fulva]KAK4630891.1 hypothetical protein CLAFUR4_03837 [Fulvia fulva]KAK4633435.1 hypothetical protein CLAFUR0_03836 [Fulvia fulva]UJO14507.1 hypothetical protein CLAFUR5_03821 [Fulvia fulva]WPV10650.1 hypothetical protein CLAFUW4_03849 [Fulvia fulva]WPV25853.1 hypothetical protein CLAFUW7_03841 [Fulvia fulva]
MPSSTTNTRNTPRRLLLLTTLLATTSALATPPPPPPCPCGYTINSTTTSPHHHHALFTQALESDFLHMHNLSTDHIWMPQACNVTPALARGPYGKASRVENVVPNPVLRGWDWGGEGVRGGDPGLELWVRGELVESEEGDGSGSGSGGRMVGMSEIVTSRMDVLYGSWRVGMKVTGVGGTCGAFFFYVDDEREIDFEFLSRQQLERSAGGGGVVNLVLQSPESAQQGYVDPGSADFSLQDLSFQPQEGYHEYRFDWLPDRVDFYADGVLLRTMRDNVPNKAGKTHLSHWSNGNEGWSGGPPEQDAVMVVSYVKGYFNSSEGGEMGVCEEGGRVCEVPDQTVAPEVRGNEGNRTGRTMFFGNESVISGTVNEPKKGEGGGVLGGRGVVGCGLLSVVGFLFFEVW